MMMMTMQQYDNDNDDTSDKKTTINSSPMKMRWHGSNEGVEGVGGRVEMARSWRREAE